MDGRLALTGLCAVAALALGAGCGGISREGVDEPAGAGRTYNVRPGQAVRVAVGRVSARCKLPEGASDAVIRYLRDGAKSALAQHDLFVVVTGASAGTNLLARFMAADAAGQTLEADADLDVEVTEVAERLGATVRVGLASSQRKYATAAVRARLRLRNGGRVYDSTGKGRSSQGAWGVVANVQRGAMKREEVWRLDGSMAGAACTEALRAAVDGVAQRVWRDVGQLTPDAADRMLRPRPGLPAPGPRP